MNIGQALSLVDKYCVSHVSQTQARVLIMALQPLLGPPENVRQKVDNHIIIEYDQPRVFIEESTWDEPEPSDAENIAEENNESCAGSRLEDEPSTWLISCGSRHAVLPSRCGLEAVLRLIMAISTWPQLAIIQVDYSDPVKAGLLNWDARKRGISSVVYWEPYTLDSPAKAMNVKMGWASDAFFIMKVWANDTAEARETLSEWVCRGSVNDVLEQISQRTPYRSSVRTCSKE